jgi:hypothetical protein
LHAGIESDLTMALWQTHLHKSQTRTGMKSSSFDVALPEQLVGTNSPSSYQLCGLSVSAARCFRDYFSAWSQRSLSQTENPENQAATEQFGVTGKRN